MQALDLWILSAIAVSHFTTQFFILLLWCTKKVGKGFVHGNLQKFVLNQSPWSAILPNWFWKMSYGRYCGIQKRLYRFWRQKWNNYFFHVAMTAFGWFFVHANFALALLLTIFEHFEFPRCRLTIVNIICIVLLVICFYWISTFCEPLALWSYNSAKLLSDSFVLNQVRLL